MSRFWFDFCFMTLQYILGHFRCDELPNPHCSWASLLGILPVLSAHSFASNWQLLFLNQRKRENGHRNFFMTKSPRKKCAGREDRTRGHLHVCCPGVTFEQPHDKTNKMDVCPLKTQISLGIRPVWSECSAGALHVDRLIWFHWAHMPFCWFWREVAHFSCSGCLASLWHTSGKINLIESELFKPFSPYLVFEFHMVYSKRSRSCTAKILSIRTPKKFAVITLKFKQDGFTKE